MTEIQDQLIDDAALNVLLQELLADTSSDVSELLQDKSLHGEVLKFLSDVSSIDSKTYLSSIPPVPSSDTANTEIDRTVVQDIAELESLQRSVDSSLKNLIIGSKDEIVENQRGLESSEKLFQDRFVNGFKDLWRSFNEDDFEEMEHGHNEDPYNLNDLELELDENHTKKNTLRSALASVKENTSAYAQNKSLLTVLENMDQITNILELPSLAGACINSGYYSEALEITSYTRRLAIKFPKSELIKKVELGIQQEMSHMLNGLMKLLKTDLKQSSLIKTLSYLRRIPPFSQSDDNSNDELKRILLHARYQFIKSQLKSLESYVKDRDYEKHLKRSIEVVREHCFSSIMIFKNVFPNVDDTELQDVVLQLEGVEKHEPEVGKEEEEHEPEVETEEGVGAIENSEEKRADEELKDKEKESGEKEEEEINISSPRNEKSNADEEMISLMEPHKERPQSNILLFEFVQNVVKALLQELLKSLPEINENSIRDGIYLQLIYCAQSLNRIDSNFNDLMTSTLCNAKRIGSDSFLIDREAWVHALRRQRQLAKSLHSK